MGFPNPSGDTFTNANTGERYKKNGDVWVRLTEPENADDLHTADEINWNEGRSSNSLFKVRDLNGSQSAIPLSTLLAAEIDQVKFTSGGNVVVKNGEPRTNESAATMSYVAIKYAEVVNELINYTVEENPQADQVPWEYYQEIWEDMLDEIDDHTAFDLLIMDDLNNTIPDVRKNLDWYRFFVFEAQRIEKKLTYLESL